MGRGIQSVEVEVEGAGAVAVTLIRTIIVTTVHFTSGSTG